MRQTASRYENTGYANVRTHPSGRGKKRKIKTNYYFVVILSKEFFWLKVLLVQILLEKNSFD